MPLALLRAHQSAANLAVLPIRYINVPAPTEPPSIFCGRIMNSVVENLLEINVTPASIIGFLDLDAFPLDIVCFWELIRYVNISGTSIGCAAASNHIAPYIEEFVSPWFSLWRLDTLRKAFESGITFLPSSHGDVCQDISRYLFAKGTRPILLSPIRYREPFHPTKKGKLAGSRCFGISTIYESGLYHAFQARLLPPHHFIQVLEYAKRSGFNIRQMQLEELFPLSSSIYESMIVSDIQAVRN